MKLLLAALLITVVNATVPAQESSLVADTTLARKWYHQALTLQKSGKFDSSNALLRKALVLYGQHQQWAQQLNCENRITFNLIQLGQHEQALQQAHRILTASVARLGEDNVIEAGAYHSIGIAYHYQGEYGQALEYYHKALRIKRKRLGDAHPEVASSYNNMGILSDAKGEYEQAIAYYQKALLIDTKTHGEAHPYVADTHENAGNLYFHQGKYSKALEYHQKALRIRLNTLGDAHPDVANTYNNLGIVYDEQGEYDKALEYYQQASEIHLKSGDETNLMSAYTLNNIGAAYRNKGEPGQALKYLQKALQIKRKVLGELHPTVGETYLNISSVHGDEGEHDQALEYLQKALLIATKALGETNPNVAYALNNIGVAYQNKGRYDQALEYLQKALQVRITALGALHPDVAASYNNVGSVYLAKGEYAKALVNYHQAIIANVPTFQDTLVARNPTLAVRANYYLNGSLLLTSLQGKARVLSQQAATTNSLHNLTLAYQTLLVADTVAQQVFHSHSSEPDKITFLTQAGQVYQQALSTSLQLHQRTRQQPYLDQAFYFASRSKASVLSASLAESKAKTFAGIPDSLLTQDQQLKVQQTRYQQKLAAELAKGQALDSAKLFHYQSKLFTAHRQQDSLMAYFEQHYPDYYQLKYKSTPVSYRQLQQQLDKQIALVEYVLGDTILHVLTLTRTTVDVTTTRIDSSFRRQLAAFRKSILTQDQGLYRATAYRLFAQLWPKTLPKAIQQVVIIPDGELTTLPFEALLTSTPEQIRSKPDYLLNHYSVSYAYSASLLYEQLTQPQAVAKKPHLLALAPVFTNSHIRRPAVSTRAVLLRNQPGPEPRLLAPAASAALGNRVDASRSATPAKTTSVAVRREASLPSAAGSLRGSVLEGEHVVPLPATEAEVQAIAGLFRAKGGQAQVYTHREAREEQVKTQDLSKYSYLHLATHGFVNEQAPELSGLLLAQDSTSQEDGVLYSGEIYNLQLNAQLVTLSACETGLGKLARGEGLIGLTRALLFAGAGSVNVSLWKVPDQSTALLMRRFYKHLLQGKSKPEALQIAKRWLGKQPAYDHPFYWGPFILVGW